MLHISGCCGGVSFQLDFPSVCRTDAFIFISDDKHKSATGNQDPLADLSVAIRCQLWNSQGKSNIIGVAWVLSLGN